MESAASRLINPATKATKAAEDAAMDATAAANLVKHRHRYDRQRNILK